MVKQALSKQYACRSILQGKHPLRLPWNSAGFIPLITAALIAFSPLPAGAENPYYNNMIDLGTLRADSSGFSHAWALSRDGTTVVGWAINDSFQLHAFRWTENSGMVDLGTLNNFGTSAANAVNADGSVVVGWSSSRGNETVACRWTETDGIIELGKLKSGNTEDAQQATAVSADGNIVAGFADNDDGNLEAFLWTEADGMIGLGTLKSDNSGESVARALDADGNVVAGWSNSDTEPAKWRAFRWTETGGMVELGTFKSDNSGASIVQALNNDGSVAVGRAESDTEEKRAFRWTEAGGMVDLGTLKSDNSGVAEAFGVSADGNVIVGKAQSEAFKDRAFRWTQDGGMIDLGTLRDDNTGQSAARDVSADGKIITGWAETNDGQPHAFLFRSMMQDYENLLVSFPLLANDADVAIAAQQWAIGSIFDQTCFAGRKGGTCLSLSGRFSYTGTDDDLGLGSRTGLTGMLSLGYGIDETITLGATAALSLTDLDHNGFDMGTGYGFGIWGEYSEDGATRTGWQLSAVAGWGTQDADITRGIGLDNVELVDGSSDLNTTSGRLSLGYGFSNPDDWVLTPRASVTAYRTRLDAYEETEGDFTASYDRLEVNTITARLDVTAAKRLGNGSKLSLRAGLDYDLDADRATLEGTSNLLGLKTFSASSTLDRNDLRPFALAAYSFKVTDSSRFTTSAGVLSPVFGSSPRIDAGLRYCVRF